MWHLIGLICEGLVVLAWIALFCFYGYWGVRAFRKSDTDEPQDPDVTLIQFGKRDWGYRFVDPYDKKTMDLGYRSAKKAKRAAAEHRERVGRELEEALGLSGLSFDDVARSQQYPYAINDKEETHE